MSDNKPSPQKGEEKQKTCFIIMPISDHPDYEIGHFKRVYEHIIKPACEAEGFTPIRADDVKVTNYIALDILKQIIECDMAICDLSSRNPNVLYEVGIRQAFNLPVTFMKDKKTVRIFDIQGFRDVSYDESLRIDTVDEAITDLSETLTNTYLNKGGINSLISMLGIEPAKISKKEISLDTELILNAIKEIRNQESSLDSVNKVDNIETDFPIPPGFVKMGRRELDALKVGDFVFNKRRGSGVIVANEEGGESLSITFDVGRYKFVKSKAVLYQQTNA